MIDTLVAVCNLFFSKLCSKKESKISNCCFLVPICKYVHWAHHELSCHLNIKCNCNLSVIRDTAQCIKHYCADQNIFL